MLIKYVLSFLIIMLGLCIFLSGCESNKKQNNCIETETAKVTREAPAFNKIETKKQLTVDEYNINENYEVQQKSNSYRTASDNKDYKISDYSQGVEIVKYLGNDKNVVIPETLDGKAVMKIGGYYRDSYFISAFADSGCKSICLPSALESLAAYSFDSISTLEMIYVSEYNPYYSSLNGVLYSKDTTILISIPVNYIKGNLKINDKTRIAYSLVYNNVKTIEIPSSLEKIKINSYYPSWYYDSDYVHPDHLKSIFVDKDNNYFASQEGVLYNKNMTELLIYPEDKVDKEFKIPDNVKKISFFYVNHINNLQTLVIGRNVKLIKMRTDFDYDVLCSYRPNPLTIKGYSNSSAYKWYKKQLDEAAEGYLKFEVIK